MIHELCKLHKVEIIVIDDSETDKTKEQMKEPYQGLKDS